ncbi:MAG: CapA family protein [Armatimonadetes bacterium]|nr:CapA family protein [Armatimonadota bacterium]
MARRSTPEQLRQEWRGWLAQRLPASFARHLPGLLDRLAETGSAPAPQAPAAAAVPRLTAAFRRAQQEAERLELARVLVHLCLQNGAAALLDPGFFGWWLAHEPVAHNVEWARRRATGVRALPDAAPQPRRRWWFVAALAVVLLAAGAGWRWPAPREPAVAEGRWPSSDAGKAREVAVLRRLDGQPVDTTLWRLGLARSGSRLEETGDRVWRWRVLPEAGAVGRAAARVALTKGPGASLRWRAAVGRDGWRLSLMPQAAAAPVPRARFLFAGDVMYDGLLRDRVRRQGAAWAFAEVRGVLRDGLVVNLETPLTDHATPTPLKTPAELRVGREFVFAAPTRAAADMAGSGVTAVCLGNNHTLDAGAAGLRETCRALEAAGVAHAGAGAGLDAALRPARLESGGVRLALLSFCADETLPRPARFGAAPGRPGLALASRDRDGRLDQVTRDSFARAVAEARTGSQVVVVALHAGHEGTVAPTATQRLLAEAALDAGADLVIGHHAHVVQPVEWYAGRPVVYGLGNFVFSGYSDRPLWQSVILRVEATPAGVWGLELAPVQIRDCRPTLSDDPALLRDLAGRLTGGEPEAPAPAARPDDLVELQGRIPGLHLDLRYAGRDNVFHTRFYTDERPRLRRAVAEKLALAQRRLAAQGYALKVWDAYRPLAVQRRMWRQVPDPRYVADPRKGGNHNRGAAVDVTLVDCRGREVEMPTGFDDFTAKAHADCAGCSAAARRHRKILQDAMTGAGFRIFATEWWHFDDAQAERYPVQ